MQARTMVPLTSISQAPQLPPKQPVGIEIPAWLAVLSQSSPMVSTVVWPFGQRTEMVLIAAGRGVTFRVFDGVNAMVQGPIALLVSLSALSTFIQSSQFDRLKKVNVVDRLAQQGSEIDVVLEGISEPIEECFSLLAVMRLPLTQRWQTFLLSELVEPTPPPGAAFKDSMQIGACHQSSMLPKSLHPAQLRITAQWCAGA